MPKKFFTLEGNWTDNLYQDLILPIFQAQNIPILKERVALFSHLYDLSYWENLKKEPPDLLTLDYRHWFFDESDFREYANKISEIKPKKLRIFDSPFGFEKPQYPYKVFEKQLYSRTSIICNRLKQQSPKTCLISPLARFINPEATNRYLQYYIDHRNLFDGCGIDFCCDWTDRVISQMGSQINQLRKISPKPAHIFLSIPCSEQWVVNSFSLDAEEWKPIRYKMAISKLNQIYQFVEQIFLSNTTWYIIGTCKDVFHRNKIPEFSNLESPCYFREDENSENWGPRSICGLLTSEGKQKTEIISEILKLNEQNS